MNTRDGRPTNALLGFIRMLGQLRRFWSPSRLIVAFDGGLSERRTGLLETYKAQRPPMPAALREQLGFVREYLEAAGIAAISLPGEEADDVMATLSERRRREGGEVLIASGDKDFFQLVGEKVSLVAAAGKPGRIGVGEVRRKTGVFPDAVVAWLALTGDGADNIPGVPGIGPKTAARLLNAYGSLETLLSNLDGIRPEGLRASLREHADTVKRNVALITLRRDLDLPFDPSDGGRIRPPPGALPDFLRRFELASLAETPPVDGNQGLLNI